MDFFRALLAVRHFRLLLLRDDDTGPGLAASLSKGAEGRQLVPVRPVHLIAGFGQALSVLECLGGWLFATALARSSGSFDADEARLLSCSGG